MMLFVFNTNIVPKVRLIGHVSYKEPWSHFPRTANEYIFYIVKSGELFIQEDQIRYELKKNDCILLEPNRYHVGYKKANCHYFFVHFQHPDIQKIEISKEQFSQEAILNRKQSLTSDCFSDHMETSAECYFPKKYTLGNPNDIFELLNAANDDFYNRYECYKNYASWKLSELVLKISREYVSTSIVAFHPRYSKAYKRALAVINYIHNNYTKKLTSAEIETYFESNYDYLNRTFQKVTGESIFHYINETRISKAKELIKTTPAKFSEIAYLVGIDDPYYFSRLFKKITGITPSQYYDDNFESNQ